MSRNQNRKSKLFAALAIFGLVMGLSVSRAGAQLSAANYAGRYACSLQDQTDAVTAIIKYGPNGTGAYNGGIMVAALNAVAGFPSVSATMDYCLYNLDLAGSSYTIGSDGTGFEVLTWVPATTNPAGCSSFPNGTATFTDQTAIAIRNDLNLAGQTIREEFADANPLDEDEAGFGTCLK
jgi:hypothetical protein